MKRAGRIILATVTLYASWIAMMAVHESGHVLGAWIGGGHVQRVIIPFAGFSRTDVAPNPSPRLEIWGGPVWGSAAPLIAWILLRKKISKVPRTAFGFFTGLCLVCNGVYLGIGWSMRAGDAADLINRGTSASVLMVFGTLATVAGFYIWHGLGRLSELFSL